MPRLFLKGLVIAVVIAMVVWLVAYSSTKPEYVSKEVSEILPGIKPACDYKLQDQFTLMYNDSTHEYVLKAKDLIHNGDDVLNLMWYSTYRDDWMVPAYLGKFSILDWFNPREKPAPVSLGRAFRFKDSCIAKGAAKAYFEYLANEARQRAIHDSLGIVQRRQDSINSSFHPVQ
jgi:hypothetical protein